MDRPRKPPPTLGELEQAVLLALLRLGDDAYGASVHRELEARTGRELALGAVYSTLARLEAKGLVRSAMGEPTARRGGRRRRQFEILPPGRDALAAAHATYRRLTQGLEEELGSP